MAQLQLRRGGEVLRMLPLEMRLLSIGRTPDNGLPLRDSKVAIRHAEISNENGVFLLTNLAGETNLTYVNGQRLAPHQPYRLEHGDEVQIGPFTIAFLHIDQPAAAPPARTGHVLVQGELNATPARPAIPTYPSPIPNKSDAAMYSQFLPPLFQESEFLSRYLKIFQTIWEPLQTRQDHLDVHFDPRLSPPQILGWMSEWLGVPFESHWPEARQRAWMQEAVTSYRWRGTRYGLTRGLETVFGLSPVLKEDSGRPHTLEIEVLDSLDGEDSASREAITAFIYRHSPAHTYVEVKFISESSAAKPSPEAKKTHPDNQ